MSKTYGSPSVEWRDQLPRLEVFAEVARRSSFTAAARALGLSQPSVSRSVAALEEHLGAQLFERDGRTVRLTEAGEAALASAQHIRDELERLGGELHARTAEPRGDLVCYAPEHVARHVLAAPVVDVVARFPKILPRVVTAPASLAVPEIADDRAEVGFYFKVESHARIEQRPIASFKCQLVCAPHKTRDARVLTSFIGSREVDDRRNVAFPTLDMLQRLRPSTTIRFSSNDLALHVEWVKAGVGVSILPLFAVERALASKTLRVVHPEWVYWADFFAVVRKGRVLSLASRTLLQNVRAACKKLGARVTGATA